MPSEFCPLCRTATNMITTVLPWTIVDKDDKMKTISITTYCCESCGSFARSIEDASATAA